MGVQLPQNRVSETTLLSSWSTLCNFPCFSTPPKFGLWAGPIFLAEKIAAQRVVGDFVYSFSCWFKHAMRI